MFADNDRISLRQMKRQMVISFLGVLLLFQSGDTAAGGIHAILGLILGTLLLLVYLFLLVRTADVYGNLEEYLGAAGKWAVTAVYLSFLILGGSVLLEKTVRVIQSCLLASLPQPVIGGMFLAAAFLGMGQNIQRRGRLAELCYPWILGFFAVLLLLAALHIRYPGLVNMGTVQLGRISGETVKVLTAGTALCLLPFSLVRVRPQKKNFAVLRRGVWILLLFTLGAAGILIGVYGWEGVRKLEYPILNLMTGTGIPGGFLGRFDIIWLAVLLFALLFSMGSLLFYGGRICGREAAANCRVRLILAAAIWLGSFLKWDEAALSDFYFRLLRDIYLPVLLVIALLTVWAKRRFQNENREREKKEE